MRADKLGLPSALLIVFSSCIASCNVEDPSISPAPIHSKALPKLQAKEFSTDKHVYFGDLHIHTSLSTDAFVFGVRALPEDVYAFAKGEVIEHAIGYPIQITRPLDFAAVTDHAEYLGQARLADLQVPSTQRPLRDLLLNGNRLGITIAWVQSTNFIRTQGFGFGVNEVQSAINRSAWQMTINAAEKNNDPGIFTAFIGYEWSGFVETESVHIHRNIIYRSNSVSARPFSYIDSQKPEDLWQFLDQENAAGRRSFAIPHNANLSNGNMYASTDSLGQPLSEEYAERRTRNEPVSEILQIKGASETHPVLSTEDEFANFEIASLGLNESSSSPEDYRGSYARDALRRGIEFSQNEGFNPYKFGVIGSSDSHNASSPSEESTFHGKLPIMDGSAGLRLGSATLLPGSLNPVTRWGSGGLAAVWAQENTRSALYDALIRKESYATSGPRIRLRFFGGWNFRRDDLSRSNLISMAYQTGVAMGGELTDRVGEQQPTFIVLASKDPEGANLDRIQIIKAWVDESGNSHEKVLNAVVSGDRRIDPTSNVTAKVGNTVDVANANYTNTIGAETLSVVWADPEFNPKHDAFYYARVVEIPTPRWSTYDAKKLSVNAPSPTSIQERAISSAIWYSP